MLGCIVTTDQAVDTEPLETYCHTEFRFSPLISDLLENELNDLHMSH